MHHRRVRTHGRNVPSPTDSRPAAGPLTVHSATPDPLGPQARRPSARPASASPGTVVGMTTTLTARRPEDLLAAVPVVLGFHPRDSLVMLTFDAAQQLPRPGRPARRPTR